jgi:two-component system phosphate regulon sensor histidine kinase PhoR
MNSSGWLSLSVRLALALAIGLVIGTIFREPWAGLAVVLGLYLLSQLMHLMRLLRWLRADQMALAPDLAGPWGELVAMVARLYRRKQFHKQRLLRLLRELRRSTAAMPDGVVVLNPQAEILWFNRTSARLLGFRGKSDFGLRIENLVRQPEFVRYLRDGNYSGPVIVRSAIGGDRYLSLQIVPYGNGQLLTLVRDVTREYRLEAMRKDFVANASHELRSPLTVISGYLETLTQDSDIDPMLAGPLQEMRRQALRMTSIVQDLLELSRLESSDSDAPRDPIDVAALMAQLRQDVLARSPHPSVVQVRADSKGGHFSVTDTGIGIAAGHIPRLTERFYRVDPGRSRATGGSGLGLAIVKHVLQRHGADLSIESEEGRGSKFTCHFPRERLHTLPVLAAVN